MAVLVKIPTVKPAPTPMGMRTENHTQSAMPLTIFRVCTFPTFCRKIRINFEGKVTNNREKLDFNLKQEILNIN